MTIAVPIEYSTGDVIGVLKAELSLRDIWDIISATKVGKAAMPIRLPDREISSPIRISG